MTVEKTIGNTEEEKRQMDEVDRALESRDWSRIAEIAISTESEEVGKHAVDAIAKMEVTDTEVVELIERKRLPEKLGLLLEIAKRANVLPVRDYARHRLAEESDALARGYEDPKKSQALLVKWLAYRQQK